MHQLAKDTLVQTVQRPWTVALDPAPSLLAAAQVLNRQHFRHQISKNLALRIAERTGVSPEWLLSDQAEDAGIPDRNGGPWDPLRLLDPLVLGDYDFRNALPMAPHLVLQLALAMVEAGCAQGLQKNDHTLLVRLMDLIKHEIDLHDPQFASQLAAKLQQPDYADALQLWTLAGLAFKQRTSPPASSSSKAPDTSKPVI